MNIKYVRFITTPFLIPPIVSSDIHSDAVFDDDGHDGFGEGDEAEVAYWNTQ